MSTEAPGPQPAETGPLAEQTDERSERADWRSSIVGTLLVSILIGVWLIVSAAVLEYEKPLNPLIWGILVVFLSLLRLLGPTRSRTLALVSVAAGVLTALSAFAVSEASGETVNLLLMGLATTVIALIGLAAASEDERATRP